MAVLINGNISYDKPANKRHLSSEKIVGYDDFRTK